MSDQQNVTSEHYSLDTVREQIQHLSQAEASHGRAIADLRRDVEVACKAGDEGIAALGKRADANDEDHKRIYLRLNSLPDQTDYDGLSDRITNLESRLTNEVSQLRRAISMENDHRKTLIDRVEGYARTAEAADKHLEQWARDQFQDASDSLDAFRDWAQEHTTSDDEWHATLSKQLASAKIVLAVGGIAIAYLMGRSTR